MRKVDECLANANKMLKKYGVANQGESRFVLRDVLQVESEDFPSEISKKTYKQFMQLIKNRCKGQPLDKVIGYTEFLGVKIPFSKHTLTPRQETEIMTERIIKDMPKGNLSVLDLCSGSGCIGLAIAKHTSAEVTLADISKKAVTCATKNAKINDLKVSIVCSNLFDNIPIKFDIIVCNPPYIRQDELKTLEKEVRKHDPKLALDGGMDGLDFYRRIISQAPDFLNSIGVLCLEVGYDQSKDVVDMLKEDFVDIQVIKDYSQINRFIIAKKRVQI